MTVESAIRAAEAILPGSPEENDDDRWQSIIAVGEFVREKPEPIWEFVQRWGNHPLEDLRDAIATVLLEHLLEHHFDVIFPRVEEAVRSDPLFAEMFCGCWKFGQSEIATNSKRFDDLQQWCSDKMI